MVMDSARAIAIVMLMVVDMAMVEAMCKAIVIVMRTDMDLAMADVVFMAIHGWWS